MRRCRQCRAPSHTPAREAVFYMESVGSSALDVGHVTNVRPDATIADPRWKWQAVEAMRFKRLRRALFAALQSPLLAAQRSQGPAACAAGTPLAARAVHAKDTRVQHVTGPSARRSALSAGRARIGRTSGACRPRARGGARLWRRDASMTAPAVAVAPPASQAPCLVDQQQRFRSAARADHTAGRAGYEPDSAAGVVALCAHRRLQISLYIREVVPPLTGIYGTAAEGSEQGDTRAAARALIQAHDWLLLYPG
ncbi:hypothetical protein WOLCODRAFT_167928 [Wolfiporia cocos MD-104 SS10]|uniref:Uncharacterized protein n=1 Tax=Wolfiporia cocos (strain MD-104) TaxID=742152 RepID=A0A2H3JTG1_WOLCO|nr:hypothetical protein WOLCODRAFT_167928 [Wolfiporia cocos MD-104 SS10]